MPPSRNGNRTAVFRKKIIFAFIPDSGNDLFRLFLPDQRNKISRFLNIKEILIWRISDTGHAAGAGTSRIFRFRKAALMASTAPSTVMIRMLITRS